MSCLHPDHPLCPPKAKEAFVPFYCVVLNGACGHRYCSDETISKKDAAIVCTCLLSCHQVFNRDAMLKDDRHTVKDACGKVIGVKLMCSTCLKNGYTKAQTTWTDVRRCWAHQQSKPVPIPHAGTRMAYAPKIAEVVSTTNVPEVQPRYNIRHRCHHHL